MCGKGLVVDSLKLGEMMCFFMQKTAYDMRISDWSSYVCSSDHGDGGLALAVGADGVHLPERLVHLAGGLRRRRRNWIITQAAQGAGAVAQALRQGGADALLVRSEEHTSELQSLMRISYAVFCLKKKKKTEREDRIP